MPTTKKHQVNVLSVVNIIFFIFEIIFLGVAIYYFINLANFRIPTPTESYILMAFAILFIIVSIAILIYAIYELVTYRSYYVNRNHPLDQNKTDDQVIEYGESGTENEKTNILMAEKRNEERSGIEY